MGIRRNYGKNKKTGRHEMLAKAQHEEMVRRVPKRGRVRARRGGSGRTRGPAA
jgi:hypothetical protein